MGMRRTAREQHPHEIWGVHRQMREEKNEITLIFFLSFSQLFSVFSYTTAAAAAIAVGFGCYG